MQSITTDYVADHGDPEPYLRAIAEAGFSHIHWCHHWRSDFLYSDAEIEQIGRWLDEYGLILNDVHGSEGVEKFWYAPKEYARLAGVELVKNRIDFAARLGSDAVVMHAYPPSQVVHAAPPNDQTSTYMRRSLDEIEPHARQRGVRIALENLIDFPAVNAGTISPANAADNYPLLQQLCDAYSPDYIGICYDSGHGHLGRDRMDGLEPLLDRLYALHLHDNDGSGDQHRLIFTDTIDWPRLADLIARSAYDKPISQETSIHRTGIEDEADFLRQALETGERFATLVDDANQSWRGKRREFKTVYR